MVLAKQWMAVLLSFALLPLPSLAKASSAKKPVSAEAMEAAELGDLPKFKQLTDKKTDFNSQDKTGVSALMRASLGGSVAITRFLLSKKVKLELQNNDHETALAFAVTNDHYDVAQLLIKSGAKVDIIVAGEEGDTLFMRAVGSDIATAKIILAKNKKLINKPNLLGETALFQAARYGTTEEVQFLLKNGADKNLKNNKGQTAVDVAKEAKNDDALKVL